MRRHVHRVLLTVVCPFVLVTVSCGQGAPRERADAEQHQQNGKSDAMAADGVHQSGSAGANTPSIDELKDNPEVVVVFVDKFDTYRVSFAGWDQDKEAPSTHELSRLLRWAREGKENPKRLVIAAHKKADYDAIVRAWDAGTDVGMEEVEPISLEE